MTRPLLFTIALLLGLVPAVTLADDSVSPPPESVVVGQQFPLTIRVEAAAGADVELDVVAESWNGIQVVSIDAIDVAGAGSIAIHTFTITAAAFELGDIAFAPTALITEDGIARARELPARPLTVSPTLQPGEPLELTPIATPATVAGAQSPLLVPAVVGLAAGVTVLTLWLIVRLVRLAKRLFSRRPVQAEPAMDERPGLDGIEDRLSTDPVGAYRALSAVVRGALAADYGFPARALTTVELQRRMEEQGVDRWLTRVAGGLLDECDQVIYAGYRPAMERRAADLAMAREVLEGPG